MLLPDDLGEGLGAIAAVQRKGRHAYEVIGAHRQAAARRPSPRPPARPPRGHAEAPPTHPPEPTYPCCLPALGEFSQIAPREGLPHSSTRSARGPGTSSRALLNVLYCLPAEDSPSGLGRTLGKRVGGNPSRVRISYPPPVPHRARRRRAPPFAVGPFVVVRLSFRLSWVSVGVRGCLRAAPRGRRRLAARRCVSMVARSRAGTGRASGPLARLPAHDRVDHDVRDAEDQQDGRGGVAGVMQAAVPDARVLAAAASRRGSRCSGSAAPPIGEVKTYPFSAQSGAGRDPLPLLLLPVLARGA